jgi:hypothetical protein
VYVTLFLIHAYGLLYAAAMPPESRDQLEETSTEHRYTIARLEQPSAIIRSQITTLQEKLNNIIPENAFAEIRHVLESLGLISASGPYNVTNQILKDIVDHGISFDFRGMDSRHTYTSASYNEMLDSKLQAEQCNIILQEQLQGFTTYLDIEKICQGWLIETDTCASDEIGKFNEYEQCAFDTADWWPTLIIYSECEDLHEDIKLAHRNEIISWIEVIKSRTLHSDALAKIAYGLLQAKENSQLEVNDEDRNITIRILLDACNRACNKLLSAAQGMLSIVESDNKYHNSGHVQHYDLQF